MERLVLAVVIVAVVAVAAVLIQRRRPDAPTQPQWSVPAQLDRADFAGVAAPWLVVVFTSATCDSCAAVVKDAAGLAGADVGLEEVEVSTRPDLHRRYTIDAVPTVVVADAEGVVRASFVGPPPTGSLAPLLDELRRPGLAGGGP